MILILGALEGEIQAFAENGEDMHTVETAFFTCMKGKLFGIPAVIAATGVGKVLAALAAQYLIDCYNPEAVIMLGAAGGLRQNMNIGDIIIATDCLQYDFDATAFGFKIGEIPYQRIGPIECDNRMLDTARSIPENRNFSIHFGRIITGDRFINLSKDRTFLQKADTLNADAVEMEGAAVGLCALKNQVPYLLIRAISDVQGKKLRMHFLEFLHTASKRLYTVCEYIITNTKLSKI